MESEVSDFMFDPHPNTLQNQLAMDRKASNYKEEEIQGYFDKIKTTSVKDMKLENKM